MASLGEELRNARQTAGLTQEALGFRAGVDRSYISDLERDQQSPTLAMLFRLCEALGVRASHLIARVEEAADEGPE
jgi:transcriptional regulator with XRE-family HTH domain